MTRDTHHVVPSIEKGGWSVKKGGAVYASVYTETKAEAVKIGRIISQRQETELVIHDNNTCTLEDRK